MKKSKLIERRKARKNCFLMFQKVEVAKVEVPGVPKECDVMRCDRCATSRVLRILGVLVDRRVRAFMNNLGPINVNTFLASKT